MESHGGAKRLAGGWPARVLVACIVVVALVAAYRSPLTAAPGAYAGHAVARAQNVDWLSAESAAKFAGVGFDVLVPTAVPGPFGGEPAIRASSGAYSLYWMITGGPPTFLEITGVAGGSMPAGSPADLNIPLEINASVQGYQAIHDLTEIYDNVWWQAGGVLYTVSSRNLTTTDSLSLANALVPLTIPTPTDPGESEEPVEQPEPPVDEPDPVEEQPAEEEPAEEQEPVAREASLILPEQVGSGETTTVAATGIDSATLVAEDGVFPDNGTSTYAGMRSWDVFWQAPSVSVDTVVAFTLIEPADGSTLASGEVLVVATLSADSPAVSTESETTEAPPETTTDVSAIAGTESTVDAPAAETLAEETQTSSGALLDVPTDGTDGPPPPVPGSDGTGGIKQVSLWRDHGSP